MRIGVPKETKIHEYRVGLTPDSVSELRAAGHEIWVEDEAGSAIGFDNAEYVRAGAKIVDTTSAFAADMAAARARIMQTLKMDAEEDGLPWPPGKENGNDR